MPWRWICGQLPWWLRDWRRSWAGRDRVLRSSDVRSSDRLGRTILVCRRRLSLRSGNVLPVWSRRRNTFTGRAGRGAAEQVAGDQRFGVDLREAALPSGIRGVLPIDRGIVWHRRDSCWVVVGGRAVQTALKILDAVSQRAAVGCCLAPRRRRPCRYAQEHGNEHYLNEPLTSHDRVLASSKSDFELRRSCRARTESRRRADAISAIGGVSALPVAKD
jgi:hypothetical protein